MDPGRQTQDQLRVSASMRTALLVYSGITVKMMVDGDLGAQLQTMFMVHYEPGGVAGAHDHPFEHALREWLTESVVLFGGLAKERPYPGSTMVSTVNGGVTGLVHTLAVELAPVRVNAIHPGIVGDSPYWRGRDLSRVIARTPTGQLPRMADIVDATVFLLRNRAVNGVNLHVDSGWLLT